MRDDRYRKYPQPTPWWVYALCGLLVAVVIVAIVTAR